MYDISSNSKFWLTNSKYTLNWIFDLKFLLIFSKFRTNFGFDQNIHDHRLPVVVNKAIKASSLFRPEFFSTIQLRQLWAKLDFYIDAHYLLRKLSRKSMVIKETGVVHKIQAS